MFVHLFLDGFQVRGQLRALSSPRRLLFPLQPLRFALNRLRLLLSERVPLFDVDFELSALPRQLSFASREFLLNFGSFRAHLLLKLLLDLLSVLNELRFVPALDFFG